MQLGTGIAIHPDLVATRQRAVRKVRSPIVGASKLRGGRALDQVNDSHAFGGVTRVGAAHGYERQR